MRIQGLYYRHSRIAVRTQVTFKNHNTAAGDAKALTGVLTSPDQLAMVLPPSVWQPTLEFVTFPYLVHSL